MSTSSQRLATSACCLAMIGLLLGTAGQSIILFLASALALLAARTQPGLLRNWRFWAPRRLDSWALLCFSGFIVWNVIATLLNPANPNRSFGSYIFSHAALFFLPPLWGFCWREQRREPAFWSRLTQGLFIFWALVTISQASIGWQLEGAQVVVHPHYQRARGFFSHPLTLAYVLLIIWPFFLVELMKNLRAPGAWLKVGCLALMFTLSASRTAQITVLVSIAWALSRTLSGQKRRLGYGLLLLLVAGLALTENPASRRFKSLFDPNDPDRFSSYPDDRLAFWHAFSGMVAERPLLGHGLRLDKDYRTPYYEAIGLGDFKKKYEAHNQLLQILAEGGLIGLLLFSASLALLVRALSQEQRLDRRVLFMTLAVFLFAGLTQNAFQDFEVRYALILMLSLARAQTSLPSRDYN